MAATRGNAWTFGDHINSESILPGGKGENFASAQDGVLAYYDPEFSVKVKPGDFIVAGRNFGASSGRPAGEVLKVKGVKAIVCNSAGMVFYRNTWNIGLPVLQCPGIREKVAKGDEIEVDVEAGTVKIMKTGELVQAKKTPPVVNHKREYLSFK